MRRNIYLCDNKMVAINLFDSPIYLSVEDAKESSTILAAHTDEEVARYIGEAQYVIDSYIGQYGTRLVIGQPLIFPVEDENIPNDISVATVYICEQISLQGNSLSVMQGARIVGESNLSRSVRYSDKESTYSYQENYGIPIKALAILNKYKSSFISPVM